MSETISVGGTGKISVPPDNIRLTIDLSAEDREYSTAMEKASVQIDDLRSRIVEAGFDGKDLKTTSFNVITDYESYDDGHGRYKREFRAYRCSHSLKLEFDLDMERLNSTLTVITASESSPELSISFGIKDEEAAKEELLRNAAKNAHRKAEILCEASGKKLGSLVKIEYNWTDHTFTSETNYNCERLLGARMKAVNIEPENIELSDTAFFIWNME